MAIGTIGKYERLDVLGHGTSGVVYLAWDTLLRRQVALKEIRAAGPEMERVLDEARVLDRLRHPNIVPIHSVDREDGAVLIDMELVRGRNLADLLKERGGAPMEPAEAARIVLAVLEALSYAHERRILHRDVKPANILIGQDGVTVKLTDFGLAEALGSGSVAGGGGTYPYMAPEDFAEHDASDYRSDLWAVGVVLYELLSGRRPFAVAQRSRDPFAWKRAIEGEDLPPVSSLRPDLGTGFDDLLKRALAKSKTDRFPTARAFADALQAATALPLPPAAAVAAPEAARGDDEEDPATFVFGNGATVVDNLDDLLRAAARHWDEARRALVEGRIERFLRAIGEVYVADLAADLAARPAESADKRLREFLDRSRAENAGLEAEEDDPDGTVVAGSVRVARNGFPARRPRRFRLRRGVSDSPAPEAQNREPEDDASRRTVPVAAAAPAVSAAALAPAAPTSSAAAAQTRAYPALRWWFWPLFIVCLLPTGAAISANAMPQGLTGRFPNILQAWIVAGVLNAMLLLVGVGARLPAMARGICFLPLAGGAFAASVLARQSLAAQHPTPDDLVRLSALALPTLILLLVQAATARQMWRAWAWIVFGAAILVTARFARVW